LDFLGFSRPKRDLSMGYKEKTADFFSRALFRREIPKQGSWALAFGRLFTRQA
jgi:hypothetical protein